MWLNDLCAEQVSPLSSSPWYINVGIDRGDGKRPDGIKVFLFFMGKNPCWDVTCVDTFAETNLNSSVVAPGYAALKAEKSKQRKYSALEARTHKLYSTLSGLK